MVAGEASGAGSEAAGELSASGDCANAGTAKAPTNRAAVNKETVRFISFSFWFLTVAKTVLNYLRYSRANQASAKTTVKYGVWSGGASVCRRNALFSIRFEP